jgi:hypothetical protein
MIVLDTNVLSALMQRQPDPVVVAWLDRQPSESVWITAITVFEIQFGIELLAPGRRRIPRPSMPCLAGTLQHPKLDYTVRPLFSALILVLILAVEGFAQFVPPAPLAVCLQNDWRFAGVRAALGTPEVVSERILETQDFREYAYSGGSIRFYVARPSATKEVWYYELPLPEGLNKFSKGNPIQDEHFDEARRIWRACDS